MAEIVDPSTNQLHQAACDACSQQISGLRFKCTHCGDVDFCTTCYQDLPNSQAHATDHIFVCIRADQIETVKMYPIAHAKYGAHEGRKCDNCFVENMVGYRYQCVQCQLDLCVSCETKGVHDPCHHRSKISPRNLFLSPLELENM